MARVNLSAITGRHCVFAGLLLIAAAITQVGSTAEPTAPAPAPEAAKPEPATPTAEPPKPAAEPPAPAPEAAKPEPATPAAESPKPAAEPPAPAPEAAKPEPAAPAADASKSAPGATPAERRLRFTFRYQRWMDVLEWFAEQADLSLVIDAPPPGSFNYSDTRDYSVTEALDLLNSVLLTKGYTLIRRDRMLTLIDLSGDFPEGLIPRVTPTEAASRGKHELVTVEFPLGRRDLDAVTAAVTPLLGPYHKLLPVAPTKQLFVTDRAGIMNDVHKVIESVAEPKLPPPAAPGPPRELKVYPIDRADPVALMSILEKLLSGVQLVFDDKLNQLNVYGTEAQHVTIQAVIDQLTSTATGERERRVDVYSLPGLGDETAAKVIETLQAIAPKATFTWNENDSNLIAWAAPAEHEAIGAALSKLSGGAAEGSQKLPQVEVYRLEQAEPTKLVEVLQKLVPNATLSYDGRSRSLVALAKPADHQTIRASLEQLKTTPTPEHEPVFEAYGIKMTGPLTAADPLVTQLQNAAPEAKINVDAPNRRLIVYAPPGQQQAIKAALEKLGLEKPTDEPRVVEVYALTTADPTATVNLLQQLAPSAEFTPDVAQQRLMALAAPADHERIKATLEKLRTAPADAQTAQLRFHPFESEPPSEVLDLFTKVAPQAKVTVDKDNHRLAVVGTAADQAAIEAAFQQYQQAAPTQGRRVLATYPIQGSDPTSLLELLKTLYPNVQIVADAPTKRLLVWASPEEQASVAASIQKLEAEPAADHLPRFESYPLHGFTTSTETATLVATLQPLAPGARFSIDSKVKNLIVWATDKEQAIVRQALERLGQGPAAENTLQLEVHRLPRTDATGALAVLQKLVPDAQLTLDAKTGTLVALAVPADQSLIRTTLQQLQATAGDGQLTVRFHALVQPPSESLMNALKEMTPGAQLTADTENKRLVAVATEADHEAIRRVIEQFESSTPLEQPRKLAVYPVTAAQRRRFEAILPTLQTEMPGLQILADDDAAAMTIWARPTEQIKIAELVKQLAHDAAPDEQMQLATYVCAAADPTTITEFIGKLFPDAKFVVDAKTRRIMIWARPADHERIKLGLEQLGAGGKPDDFQQHFQAYPLSKIAPETVVPLLQQNIPTARILADAKSGRILVWADKADHEQIAEAIDQLQSAPDDPHKPRLVVYPRPNADPQAIVQMLTALVPQARVSVDAQTGGLAAWATPEDHQTIRSTIDEMSKAEVVAAKPASKVYALKNVTAEAALRVLSSAVPTARLSAGADETQLVAVAPPTDQQMIQAILDELDTDSAAASKSSVAIYRLEHKTSSTAVLYALNVFRSAFPRANFTLGADVGEFVAWANAKDHAGIKTLVDQLNAEPAPENRPVVALYSLKSISATSAVPVLQAAVPNATFTVDPANAQRLTALGRPAEHEQIKSILTAIDVEGEPGSEPSVTVYRLDHPAAATTMSYAISLLTQAFPRARLLSGPEPGQFVAWASAKDHAGIRALVDQLNAGPPADEAPEATVYALQHITAATAMSLLSTAAPKAKLTSDTENPRRLAAFASPADQATIKAILAKIDVEGDPAGDATVAVYRLRGESVGSSLYYTLTVFRTAFPKATFSVGSDPGQFVAWATPKEHEGIKTLVDQLNAAPPPEETPEATVYSLKHITAATATSLLSTAVPHAKLSADTENPRRLTVYANPADQATIKGILDKVDIESDPAGEASAAVYRLEGPSAASTLSYSLTAFRAAFPKATFSPGTDPTQFIAWATPKEHEGIKSLVDRLNAAPPPDKTPEAAVYSLQHITAATATSLLSTAVPQAKLSTDTENPRRLTVYATPTDQTAIKAILDKIDVEGDSAGDATVGVYRLEGVPAGSPVYYRLAVFREAFPKATFSSGSDPGQFVAWATPKDHEGIKALVQQMNAEPPPDEATTVALYTTKWITAATAAEVLRTAVPKATFTVDTGNPQRLTANARAAGHEAIKKVLATIDVETDPDTEGATSVYRLDGLGTAAELAASLSVFRAAFPKATFSPGVEPGQFIAWAVPQDHTRIAALVAQLNAVPPEDEAPKVVLYTLQWISAATATGILQTAVPRATFTPDADDPQRLAVRAVPADHKAIAEVLTEVDVEGAGGGRAAAVIYQLEGPAAATQLSYTLTAFRTAFPKATFSPGAEPGQFVAWAMPKDHEAIKSLVDQMNAGLPPERAPQVEVYVLREIPASSAAEVLRTAVPKATFTVDPANAQRLTANARAADHETIKKILAKIDVEGQPEDEPSVVVYQLERQTTMAGMSYATNLLSQAFPRARVLPGADLGQFIAWASAKDHKGIQALVDRLNAGPPPEQKPEAAVYSLQHVTADTALNLLRVAVPRAQFAADPADPQRLNAFANPTDQATIKDIVAKIDIEGDPTGGATAVVYQLDTQASSGSVYYTLTVFRTAFPKATFSPGAEPGQFVAWAMPKDHEAIKSLVEQMNADLPPDQKPMVTLYTLQFITATTAAEVLRDAVPKATFTIDPDDPQRLTANARRADQETIKQILSQIDVEGEGGGRAAVEIYKLMGPQAQTAMTYALRLLTTAFPRARFSAGVEPNQFVAWASPRDHAEIRALVDRLNAAPPPDETATASVYSLKNITAATAQAVLTNAVPNATLTVDPADPQRLTAYAMPLEQATIKAIIDKIDVVGDPDASYSVRVYTLEGMSTRMVYFASVFLGRVLPNARFTPGAEESQLVVWATAKDHEQIGELIEQLQKEPPPALARKIAVYPLQYLAADAAIALLRSAMPRAELTASSTDTQQISAWATPADHARIQTILKEVDVKPDPEFAATAVVYDLQDMTPTAATAAVQFLRQAVPKANFALGGDGRQVVAWARAADHEAIAQLVKQLAEESPDSARTAQIYSLQHATATTALAALTPVVPRASLTVGADPNQLAAFARPADHAKIAKILEELDKPAPPETEPTAIVYSLDSGSVADAMRVVRAAVPQASLSIGAEAHQMVAWARPADHKIIQQIVERLSDKGPPELARKAAVYTIESGDAATAMRLLQTAVPGAQFSVGSDPRRLIAWATPADHEAIQRAVGEIVTGAAQMTSQVYRLRYGDPQTALTVLQALVPQAKMAVDAKEGALVASAVPEDQQKIKATIEQMDVEDADGQRPTLKIHRIAIGSVTNAFRSLMTLFRTDPAVQLSLDMDNDAIVAVASGPKQERIAELIKALEDAARQDAQATIQMYSLRNVDSSSVLRLLEQMLDKQAGKADLSVDALSNQLIAVAPPEVHAQIAKTIEQLRGDEADLEIYDLQYVDPTSAEMAIARQFYDEGTRAPEVSVDPITQQLFIRATTDQQQKIRQLLIKMGETRLSVLGGRSTQNMRTLPFSGDPKAAIDQIRRVWATLRDNEIRVVGPDELPSAQGSKPDARPVAAPQPKDKAGATDAEDAGSASKSRRKSGPKRADKRDAKIDRGADAQADNAAHNETDEKPNDEPATKGNPKPDDGAAFWDTPSAAGPFRFVAAQSVVTDDASSAEDPRDKPTLHKPRSRGAAASEPAAATSDDRDAHPDSDAAAPIYVVPSEGSITIVCDDHEALEQFDKLLRAMSGTSGEIGRNISIYPLKHSNAVEIAEKLRELYDMRRRGWRLGGAEVVIVPDERLNRILVQGSRIDRETIDGLIRALDTEEGTASRPQIVPVQYAEATEVANVVRDVFRSQLTRTATATPAAPGMRSLGASRVVPQVAVDEATNSLIVMAPSPLLDEILKLVGSLDQAAEQNPARRLRIISLQKASASRVDEALQRILKSRPPRPAR